MQTYSAKPPAPTAPNTLSPGLNSVTFIPTASTCPAMSAPSFGFLGLRSPRPCGLGTVRLSCDASPGDSRLPQSLLSTPDSRLAQAFLPPQAAAHPVSHTWGTKLLS